MRIVEVAYKGYPAKSSSIHTKVESSVRQSEKGVVDMPDNRGVVFKGPGKVEVETIPFPKFEDPQGKKIEHGVILKIVCTNICGSDQHMVRGRTTAPAGMVLGHEITGEVIEKGSDVKFINKGDLVSVPFNIACGRCRACRERNTGVCLNVNEKQPGGAYGYVDMGGWIGGQAQYVMVPYADFNLLKFPDKDEAMEKITDLTMLSDILPTGFHGAKSAGVDVGSTVYVAGAGPVGMAAAASSYILGAAVVIVGDKNEERLAHARKMGYETINIGEHDDLGEQIEQITGEPTVDAAIDAVGFEASGHGTPNEAAPAAVLNSLMDITFVAGGLGIPGLYVTEDPGAPNEDSKKGILKIRFGKGWSKSLHFHTGQAPVLQYNRKLMQAILHDRLPIAKIVNATIISLDQAPEGYKQFDSGVAKKFVIDPNGLLSKAKKPA
jgi:glutathione-independent formaldehyde dehydrogenase